MQSNLLETYWPVQTSLWICPFAEMYKVVNVRNHICKDGTAGRPKKVKK